MCSVGQMGAIVSPVPATQPPPSPLSNTTQFLSCVCDDFMLILLSPALALTSGTVQSSYVNV